MGFYHEKLTTRWTNIYGSTLVALKLLNIVQLRGLGFGKLRVLQLKKIGFTTLHAHMNIYIYMNQFIVEVDGRQILPLAPSFFETRVTSLFDQRRLPIWIHLAYVHFLLYTDMYSKYMRYSYRTTSEMIFQRRGLGRFGLQGSCTALERTAAHDRFGSKGKGLGET